MQADHVDLAHRLVSCQHLGDVGGLVSYLLELTDQFDCILQRQFGARSDGKVRRVNGVAHQHHMALSLFHPPCLASHALEVEPGRASQVAGVGHQGLSLQIRGKELFAKCHRGRRVGLIQTVGQPHVLGAFDDEGRSLLVKFVHMRLKPAVLGFFKQKRKSVIKFVRAQPDVSVRSGHDIGLKDVGMPLSHHRVDAVAGDHQIGVGIVELGLGLAFEHQFHPQGFAPRLQDVEQFFAADADKAMSPRADHPPLEMHLDVVPMVKGLFDFLRRNGVPGLHVLHGLVREDHSPTKGVIRLVALDHGDVVRGVEFFHQQGEIQSGWPATDAYDLHGISLKPEYFKLKVIVKAMNPPCISGNP